MKWLIDNWSLLVIAAAVVTTVIVWVKKVGSLSRDEQILKVKEWLLYAVTLAEKEMGGGTGRIKLRYVYDMFITKFPDLADLISFETFSGWVDSALENMRHLVETNKKVQEYVEGE